MLCSSCKNSKSTERCPAPALKNLLFCGKHAKVSKPRLWAEANPTGPQAILIQKIWRGWIVRYRMNLAGPGVLNRKICHNEEDVITYIERDKIHPFDYFGFHEDDKVFCFDVRSLFQLSIDKLQPENPYTRQQLSLDTRKRLKNVIYRRGIRRLPLFYDRMYDADEEKLFNMRWMMISQFLEEHLFVDLNPMFFTALNRTQLWEFTGLLRNNLMIWAKEHKDQNSRRILYYIWINMCWKRQTLSIESEQQVCQYLGKALLKMLMDAKNPYDVCFKILSARHSL
jgi:hypothetical protein